MDTPVASLLWFVVVLALIPAALWVLKRMTVVKGTQSAPSRIVGMMPLSGSQRILTVEVGQGEQRVWLVLGVTPSSIQLLHTLPARDVGPVNTAPPSPFAQALQRWRSSAEGKT